MSYSPNRIVLIRNAGGKCWWLWCLIPGPGVDGTGDVDVAVGVEGKSVVICCNAAERRGRDGPGVEKSNGSEVVERAVGGTIDRLSFS